MPNPAEPTTSNPLENSQVKELLADVANINSAHDFRRWQKSFLQAFTLFLDTDGSNKASAAYQTFRQSSGGLYNLCQTLQTHIDAGNITLERTTVKGRRAISELGTVLGQLVDALQLILPTTSAQIAQLGFTKYHMGAVLVEDGFREYAVMTYCQTLMAHLRSAGLDETADPKVLEAIDYFGNQFAVFCGVMESLNLMQVCKTAEKFLHTELTVESQRIVDGAQVERAQSIEGRPSSTPLPMEQKVPSPPKAPLVPEPPLPEPVTPAKKVVPTVKAKPAPKFSLEVTYKPKKGEDPKKTMKQVLIPTDSNHGMQEVIQPSGNLLGGNDYYDDDDDDDDFMASGSSWEEVETVITISTYETIEQEDDNSDSSYETVEVDEPSEYETDEEVIVVSDYVTDSEASDRGYSTKPVKPKKKSKKVSSTSCNDNNSAEISDGIKSHKKSKSGRPKQHLNGKGVSRNSKPNKPSVSPRKAPGMEGGQRAPRRNSMQTTGGPLRRMPRRLSAPQIAPAFEDRQAKSMRALPDCNPVSPLPRYRDDLNDSDNGEKDQEDDNPDSNDSSDESKGHRDGNFAGPSPRDQTGKASDEVDASLSVASAQEEDGEPGTIRPRSPVVPKSPPPSPTSNIKPVARMSWTSKDYYHGHGANTDCFNLWKEFKKPGTAPALKKGEPETSPASETKKANTTTTLDEDSNPADAFTKQTTAKKYKRIERTETRQTRRKVKEAGKRTIHQKVEHTPKTIRIRHTRHVVQTKLVKKGKAVN